MELIRIYLKRLRNDEHQQYCSDIRAVTLEAKPEILRVDTKFWAFDKCCTIEMEALKKIIRSPITPQIQDADRNRDEIFRGLSDANLAATRHYTPNIREAAKRIQIVFDTYGNITKKPIAEQTSAVDGLISELTVKYIADVETVGLKGWIDELGSRNASVASLMRERYNEVAEQSDLVMRTVRAETDIAYRNLMRRIDALAEVASEDEPEKAVLYENLIRRLNAVTARANDILAARRGRTGDTGDEPDAEE